MGTKGQSYEEAFQRKLDELKRNLQMKKKKSGKRGC